MTFTAQQTAFLFPGQGAQSVGMAADFMQADETKNLFEEANDALGFNLSLLMQEGPNEALTLTQNTQPALLLAGAVAVRYMLARSGAQNIAAFSNCVAGHSLGEYTALVAAGALSLTDGLKLVRLRGEAMQQAVPEGKGAMAAVLGLAYEKIADITAGTPVYIANDNSEGQVVVSGEATAVHGLLDAFKEAGAKRSVLLDVSAPFHCPLMQPAQDRMAEAIAATAFAAPCVPVMQNVTAALTADVSALKAGLVEQVTGRVRWRETMQHMADAGVVCTAEWGCGKVLTGMAKRVTGITEAEALTTRAEIDIWLEKESRLARAS